MTEQRRPLLLAAGCLLAFILLLVLVAVDSPVGAVDRAVRDALVARPGRPLVGLADDIAAIASPLADAIVLAVGAAALAWRQRRLGPLIAVALTGWLMTLVVVGVKHGLGRPAPTASEPPTGGSFPSGHTAAALVCFGALALLAAAQRPSWTRPLIAGVAALTAVVAAALVWTNYHWLSDTIGSILLGIGLLVPLHLWLRRWGTA